MDYREREGDREGHFDLLKPAAAGRRFENKIQIYTTVNAVCSGYSPREDIHSGQSLIMSEEASNNPGYNYSAFTAEELDNYFNELIGNIVRTFFFVAYFFYIIIVNFLPITCFPRRVC